MDIKSIHSFTGRNIYSHRPVIKMLIDLGNLCDRETKDINGFNEKLLELFPGLKEHCCSTGCKGGFVKRLYEGTYIGHVVEHVILELQALLGYDARFGRTRLVQPPSLYSIVFEYLNERCAIECARTAVNMVDCIIAGKDAKLSEALDTLRKVAVESELGPSTKAIYDEAIKRGIPVTRLGNDSILQLGYGKYLRRLEASLPDTASCIAVDIAGNKYLTKQILAENNIPVPPGDIAYTEESAVFLAEKIAYPVVVKPFDGNQGRGVVLNIRDEQQVRQAYREAIKYSKAVIVEKYIEGRDFRVLVVGNKVSAVSERRPPSISGDGIHTVKELVELKNMNENRGEDHEKPLTKIKLDSIAKQVLHRKGIDENYIPLPNEEITLRDNGNLSTGGTARDCTDEIHPYNAQIAVKAAKAVGLDIAGIDMTVQNISEPLVDYNSGCNNGAVIEVNAAPGLRMHLYPSEGQARNVASDILDMMFPQGKPHTIPIISITGTNGKTTTARLIRHVLSSMGLTVGMTSTGGIYIGDECILEGDNTGPVSARMVLSDTRVEAAVLETARGGIVKKGLGYDLADVGVVTNISDDHLGLDDINTLEDMANVKSLVIEAVKPDGHAVVNADDKMVNYLLKKAKCQVVLFSKQAENILVKSHIKAGGKAVYIRDGYIYIFDNKTSIKLINVAEIPITMGGIAECNIENSLASIGTLYSIGVPAELIKKGLKSFLPNLEFNPGRFNIFDMGYFKIMLDYGHNPAGYSAVARLIKKIEATRYVGVIGMPGDRLDRNYREAGEICGKVFSKIYIKEDEDKRGRECGEVARILYESVIKGGIRKEDVEIVPYELKALEKAILGAQPGDMIVMFYEKLRPAVDLIHNYAVNFHVQPAYSLYATGVQGDAAKLNSI